MQQLIGRLASATSPRTGRPLSDAAIRSIVNPVRACLATAVEDGLLRHNPAIRPHFPHRPRPDADGEREVRALSREQLRDLLALVHPRHRLMFRLLAATGLRSSELFALRWSDLRLDGAHPHVRVRRAFVKGRFEPPKSRHGKREVPLDATLVSDLRRARTETEWPGDSDLVFPSTAGTPLAYSNVLRRVLRPVAEEVGVPWAGFHAFRHTCASLLFARGANVKQVQRWLGHHSASFTLDTYVHLLSERLDAPLARRGASDAETVAGDGGTDAEAVAGDGQAIDGGLAGEPEKASRISGAEGGEVRKQPWRKPFSRRKPPRATP